VLSRPAVGIAKVLAALAGVFSRPTVGIAKVLAALAGVFSRPTVGITVVLFRFSESREVLAALAVF
jgi:hypothetical protein